MKKLTIGVTSFIAGAVIMSSMSVFAASPAIQKITANINNTILLKLNGEKVKTEQPVLTYNGRTYVYLKDIGELVGASVEWNNSDKSVEIVTEQVELPNEEGGIDEGKLLNIAALIDKLKTLTLKYDIDKNEANLTIDDIVYYSYNNLTKNQDKLSFLMNVLSRVHLDNMDIVTSKTFETMKVNIIHKNKVVLIFTDEGSDNHNKDLRFN
ncbi:stalk domain-containing protein [Paenibacillus sp. GCM10027627]|uniref:stalk domain-containing protein n=1 Tax=unclassified Paenibacillus TaxID=185978 RepID=UPI00362D0496